MAALKQLDIADLGDFIPFHFFSSFECYVCQKQFNRANHVTKHFLRMHRDHPYDLNRTQEKYRNLLRWLSIEVSYFVLW